MEAIKMIRKNIRDLIPYSSARSEFKGKAEVFLDANENPYDELLKYNRYPDPYHVELKSLIGELKSINPEDIFLGNGSDEIIDIIIRMFCIPGRDSVLTFSPGFGMFKVAASINDVKCKEIRLEDDFSLNVDTLLSMITEDLKVIFLCSPNNPTGNSIPRNIVEKICHTSGRIVVVDEAYIDYSDEGSMIALLDKFDNLIILQTMSKAHGGAGLRIGMAFGRKEIVEYMNKIKMPYNISEANQQKAIELLSNKERYQLMLVEVRAEKQRLWDKLNSYSKIQKIYPSDANFFLIKLRNAADIYKTLCSVGVIVRNLSSKPGCENCLRITVGTPHQNDRLFQQLDKLLK